MCLRLDLLKKKHTIHRHLGSVEALDMAFRSKGKAGIAVCLSPSGKLSKIGPDSRGF